MFLKTSYGSVMFRVAITIQLRLKIYTVYLKALKSFLNRYKLPSPKVNAVDKNLITRWFLKLL